MDVTDLLTHPRNVSRNDWVNRWLEENGISTERFVEGMQNNIEDSRKRKI